MSKVFSVRLPDELADWVAAYAVERGWKPQALLEQAIMSYKDDCDTGVPEFRERLARVRANSAPRAGECSCPILPPDNKRGFSQKCPVHGRTREDFNRSVAERSALFRTLDAPESVRFGVEAAAKMKARREGGEKDA